MRKIMKAECNRACSKLPRRILFYVKIRKFLLVKEGNYQDAKFFIRYFQPDGKGELRVDDGTVFKPNDLYPLTKEAFRLYYTSRGTDQQVIDVYIQDNFGQVIQKTFSFQNQSIKEEDEGGTPLS
ncbi:hypothetical protein EZS27_024186 [termite gut metagenome]|uniref:DUF3872 domain-containing protein n=1 Tax=termite gut metagenome TaxID=433724 RepID=A0A5J4QYJ2_9ZZZZ